MLSLTFLLLCSPLVAIATGEQLTKDLPMDKFSSFVNEGGVKVLFFYLPEDQIPIEISPGDLPDTAEGGTRGASWEKAAITTASRQANFLKLFEQSAQALRPYKVELGKLPCDANAPSVLDPYCDRVDVTYHIHGFRDGELMEEWPLEDMLTIDAILSNILQLVLRNNIPTISSKEERQDTLQGLKGKMNYVLGYNKYIGNYEHRIFMEVANSNRDTVKFATTTDKRAVSDLVGYDWFDDAAVFVFYCKEATGSRPCQLVKYLDSLDLVSFHRFISALDLPAIHDVSEEGDFNPFEAKGLNTAVVFYDRQTEAHVKQESTEIALKLRGLLAILLVNIEETDAFAYGYDGNAQLPTFALKLQGSNKLGKFKPADQSAIEFLVAELAPNVRGLREKLLDEFADGFNEDLEEHEDRSYEANVEKEDSPIADTEFYLRGTLWPVERDIDVQRAGTPIDRTNVPALTEDNFEETVADTDLLFVMFYLYNDMRAITTLRRYVDAANILNKEGINMMTAVECYENTMLCRKEKIWVYPIIRVYRKGQGFVKYDGILGRDAFITAAKLNMEDAPVVLKSQDDATRFVEGQLPANAASVTQTAILGLFGDNDKDEISSFTQAAEMSQGLLLYGIATGQLADKLASEYGTQTPGIVVYRRNDKMQPFTSGKAESCPMKIREFVTQATEPIFPELTPSNFLAYHSTGKPLVVLLTDRADSDLHAALGALVKEERFPGAVIAWMFANEAGTAGARILMEYDSRAVLPVLAVVNHEQGTVHLNEDVTAAGATNWIQSVLDGNVLFTKRLNGHRWQARNPGYDFLAKSDDYQKQVDEYEEKVLQRPKTPPPKDYRRVYDRDAEETLREALLQHTPGLLHDEF